MTFDLRLNGVGLFQPTGSIIHMSCTVEFSCDSEIWLQMLTGGQLDRQMLAMRSHFTFVSDIGLSLTQTPPTKGLLPFPECTSGGIVSRFDNTLK